VRKRILFVCRSNSSQSQLAEALARIWAHGAVHAYSAGIAPSREVNPKAIAVMRELGYDLRDHRPTAVSVYQADHFDVAVLIDCKIDQTLRADRFESWNNLPDPTDAEIDLFRLLRDLLAERVRDLLGPAVTITRDPKSVKAALIASQAKPMPMRVAAALAYHEVHGKLPPNTAQALNDMAYALSQVGDVYYLTERQRLRRLAQEDIAAGAFEDSGATLRTGTGRRFTSLSMRRGEILDAIAALKKAHESASRWMAGELR
jgi:arsenate reductase